MKRTFSASLRPALFVVLGLCLGTGLPAGALGGGGPENVLLVVNRNSPDSLTIANHYIRLRHVPAGNVLTLPWDPKVQTTDVNTFRNRILTPVLTAIQKRRLARQIDYVVYSSDFPWGINLRADVAKFLTAAQESDQPDPDKPESTRTWPKHLTQVGSINGLTYLCGPVVAESMAYMDLRSNRYMRLGIAEQEDARTLGFTSRQQFGPRGELLGSGGWSYLLSTVLGVTAGCGNTVEEVLSYLRRSAAADGTHPAGKIYFVLNQDIRSKARHHVFPEAVSELKKLGIAAAIVEGRVPIREDDVQGAVTGTASFSWKASRSTILPGAICENFTSFGGVMSTGGRGGQTPLSEFLRYGAAGSSGTVTEPYSILAKFPLPMIQVHYARGCTLAEAFYQSVHGPYQLLIVGDPLCRPWANIPQVTVQGVEPGAVIKGNLTLKASATVPGGSKVDRFRLFIDGWLRAECGPGGLLELDTGRLADGYHQLRVVAEEAGLIRSQGRQIMAISTANHGREITASIAPTGTVRTDTPLVLSADSPGSTGIAVLHNSRLIGKIAGESGRVEIDPALLGYGPVRLRVVGLGKGGSTSYVWAQPLEFIVERE